MNESLCIELDDECTGLNEESLCIGLNDESGYYGRTYSRSIFRPTYLWNEHTRINNKCSDDEICHYNCNYDDFYELFNFSRCNECGEKYKKYPYGPHSNYLNCPDCYLKNCVSCKECKQNYFLTDDAYDDYYDGNHYSMVCSYECNLHWIRHQKGDPYDMWYDEGHSGYNSYFYSWKRMEDIIYLNNTQISNKSKFAFLKKRMSNIRNELVAFSFDTYFINSKKNSNKDKYALIKKRMDICHDELLSVALHPDRIKEQLSLGVKMSDF